MRRKDFLKLVQLEEYEDAKGRVRHRGVYVGPRYAFDEQVRHAAASRGWILAVIAAVAFGAAGFVPRSVCQHTFWVLFFYAFSLLPVAYVFGGLWKVWRMRDTATEFELRDGVDQLRNGALAQCLLGVLWTVASLVCMIVSRQAVVSWAAEIGFLLLGAVTGACGFLQYRSISGLKMTLIEEAPADES